MRPLVWFRRDLRIEDHTALHEASRAATRGIVAAYVVCPQEWTNHDDAPVKIDFWLRNLRELSASLGRRNIPLIVIEVAATNQIAARLVALARESACDAIYLNHEYEVNERARDDALVRHATKAGIAVRAFHDHVVFDPASIRTGADGFYSVFTPFKRAFLKRAVSEELRVLPAPKSQPELPMKPSPIPDRIEGFVSCVDPALWPAGESHARSRLNEFCRERLDGYRAQRDRPDLNLTSRLSPYLNSGVLSPRQCLLAASKAKGGAIDEERPGAEGPSTWISELIWREFYQHVLVGFPRVSMGRAFKPATDRIAWSRDPSLFSAWSAGRTGVPIVDAAMRQLHATGWMHNRLRMIVAMYLTKDLFVDWRLGERHFMRHLIDGDLGSNNGGWQWSASTGTDAAPYFRIFNPITQSRKCDPNGDFIRKWLPELRELDAESIHDPATLPALQRARLDYPVPIVDRATVKDRVLAAFKAIA